MSPHAGWPLGIVLLGLTHDLLHKGSDLTDQVRHTYSFSVHDVDAPAVHLTRIQNLQSTTNQRGVVSVFNAHQHTPRSWAVFNYALHGVTL